MVYKILGIASQLKEISGNLISSITGQFTARATASILLLSLLLVSMSQSLAATQLESSPMDAHVAFTNWISRFSVERDPGKRHEMISEGKGLAELRRKLIAHLIKADPGEAIRLSISDLAREKLPSTIATKLERQVSGLGDFEVFCADYPRGASGVESTLRFVSIGGERFRAFVYGRRTGQTTKYGIPLHGIALGGALALDEEVLAVTEGSPPLTARLSNKLVRFRSAAELQDAEKKLEDAESGLGPEPTFHAMDFLRAEGTLRITPNAGGGHGGGGGGGGSGSTWTTGNKKVLVIRVDFSDLPGAPSGMTAADVQFVADQQIGPYYLASSYGLTSLSNTVTAVYRMPQPAAFYATNNNTTQLMTDAQSAAGANYTLSGFDRLIVFFSSMTYLPNSQFSWSGLSGVGSGQTWINGVFTFGNVAHELGHTYGLYHANLWLVSDSNPISASGRSVEYYDDYDTMGGNWGNDLRTDFNPWFKSMLGWISTGQIQSVTANGTYRVNRYDIANAGGMLALKIVKDASHNYWVCYKGNFTNNPSLQNGAYVIWGYNSNNHSDLMDIGTPGDGDADAGMVAGTSLADTAANLGIAAMAQGASGTTQYLDIKVTFGSAAPAIYAQPQSQTAISGQNAFFPVVAAGIPTPVYHWQRKAAGAANWTNLIEGTVYSGTTNSGLTVNGVTLAMDSDQFRCVLTNASGSITTAPAAVLSVLSSGVTTLAGLAGAFGLQDGTGSSARFQQVASLVVDGLGNVYVADRNNYAIRKITRNGVVTTIAGQHTRGTTDGTNSAALFSDPWGICMDSWGNLYVADGGSEMIRKITPQGTNWVVTTLAGQPYTSGTADGVGTNALFNFPTSIAVDPATNLYVADTGSSTLRKMSLSGTNWVVSTLAVGLASSRAVCVDHAGTIYVASLFGNVIDVVKPNGSVAVLAGSGGYGIQDGVGTNAVIEGPQGIAVDLLGNLYVTDNHNCIRKIGPGAVVTTITGQPGASGSTDGTLTNASFYNPLGLAADAEGNVYVADNLNYVVRKIVMGAAIPLPRLDGPTVTSNRMRFVLDGPAGTNYYVQASTNLSNWSVLSTNIIPIGGWLTIQDSVSNRPGRFYRASTQLH